MATVTLETLWGPNKRSIHDPVPMVTVLAGISDHWVVCDMSSQCPA